jgi:hypothetical protein
MLIVAEVEMRRKFKRALVGIPSIELIQHQVIERLETRLLLAAQAYNWSDANIGAGGFLDGVFFDQNNSGVMYARTDIGGLYKTTNGGNNWTPLLDWVGNGNGTSGAEMQVLGFAIDPENSNNIYALTGGGVLYSTDGGESGGVPGSSNWALATGSTTTNGNGADRAAGERIAVDPYDSNIVIEGSNTVNGLYESTNAGHSFSVVSSFPSASVSTIAFDPYGGTVNTPTQTILVGVASSASGSNLYKTTGGATGAWSVIGGTGAPSNKYAMRAAFDSTNDGDV